MEVTPSEIAELANKSTEDLRQMLKAERFKLESRNISKMKKSDLARLILVFKRMNKISSEMPNLDYLSTKGGGLPPRDIPIQQVKTDDFELDLPLYPKKRLTQGTSRGLRKPKEKKPSINSQNGESGNNIVISGGAGIQE